MKKTLTRALLACLLVLTMVLACGCKNASDPTDPPASNWKVTFYESDGTTVLQEVEVANGETVTAPELTKDGYIIEGYYATPALMVEFDFTQAITEDTAVFVAWQSSVVDERPWMLAGSFKDYPENAWGKIWPQDEWLLKPVEDQFNTYEITLNLHEGDEFKIAVIGEGYAWSATDSLDSRNVVKSEYITGGEDAFDTGANIKVL